MTHTELEQVAQQVYDMILEGNAASKDYTETVTAPTTAEEQSKWTLLAVKNISDDENRSSGNINLKGILDAYAGEVIELTDNAKTILHNIQTSASNAQTYASQAQTAKTDAESAKTTAENAKTAAETAKENAIEAKTAAESAKTSAESARDDAIAAKNQAEAIVTSSVTGAASSIMTANLTANRALVSDSSGKVAVSDVTAAELGYLGGSVSNIQAQINHAMMNLFAIRALTTEEIDEVMA